METKPIILMRASLAEDNEKNVAKKYFHVVNNRSECYINKVIPRYSLLPYPEEVHWDLDNQFCDTINSLFQHQWIADFSWYNAVKDYTPESWKEKDFHLCKYSGPFVVKGCTNSKKFQWNTCMFAKDKYQASEIACNLKQDMYLCDQDIIIRKYVQLNVFEEGLNELPFSEEYRLFFYKEWLLADGYYWSCAEKTDYTIPEDGLQFGLDIAKKIEKHVNFFVLDVAKTENGDWILIEINDGCMSGLSECNPDELYRNLRNAIKDK